MEEKPQEKKKIFQFEPINLTKIITTLIVLTVVMIFFRPELTAFMDSLSERGFSVSADGTFTFDAVTEPSTVLTNVSDNPDITAQNSMQERELRDLSNDEVRPGDFSSFGKSSLTDLMDRIQNLKEGDIAVVDYRVNYPGSYYYNDTNMLKYLTIASAKVRYLAFYDSDGFQGYIKIERVIKGLAANEPAFKNFGEKLKNNRWRQFKDLVPVTHSFSEPPTISQLHDALVESGQDEVPLLSNGRLTAILTYEDIVKSIYEQKKESQRNRST